MNEHYYDSEHGILDGSLPIKSIYGKFPEFLEVMSVIRNIYGEDFMEIFELGFKRIDNTFNDDLVSLDIPPRSSQEIPELLAVEEN